MAVLEVKVPNLGDFRDVEIIEVHVKPGDKVELLADTQRLHAFDLETDRTIGHAQERAAVAR